MSAALPQGLSAHILGLRHVGVVTPDREALLERLLAIFAIPEEEVLRIPADNSPSDTRFAFLNIGGTPYEIIEPSSPRFRELLLNSGTGANHVCYTVDNLDAAVEAMAAAGVRLGHVTPDGIVQTPRFRMAYFNPEDTGGLLIELVQDLP